MFADTYQWFMEQPGTVERLWPVELAIRAIGAAKHNE
jgi:hypothetical protein